MRKFELFLCCLGNGTTVCNKAVEEHGDYKTVAHIADCGKITWYVEPHTIPADALDRIKKCADDSAERFDRWLASMPEIKQYGYLLDHAPHTAFMYALHLDCERAKKIEYLKSVLYDRATW